MTNTHRHPGTRVAIAFPARIIGGDLRNSLRLKLRDGSELGVKLIPGVDVAGQVALGASVQVTMAGVIISNGPQTAELMYNDPYKATARIPHALISQAAA